MNIDLVVTAPVLPRAGETVLGHDFTQVAGGKGANQAVAAARAGGATTVIGAIGSDAFGVTLRARLSGAGVDTSLLRIRYGASGVALIVVDDFGENSIVVAPGANATLADLTAGELAAIAGADVLLCQLEVPVETVTAAAVAARAAGTLVVLNATPVRALPDELLAAVDLLVVNHLEAAGLTNLPMVDVDTGDAPDGAVLVDALLESVPRAVLTRGADGAWYGDRDGRLEHVPAPVVEAVDTTGAGDAFTGALAVAWGEGRDVVESVRWASAAGAASVRRLGASVGLAGRQVIDELYAATYCTGADE
ncbi:ribokinase [Rugosimonospora acidiphila]|uniref:Ribokinase n=1 Tax=Rugosimonospora acidiphila TaxID=556531 RepID=A0ABP9RQF8_9ACTN